MKHFVLACNYAFFVTLNILKEYHQIFEFQTLILMYESAPVVLLHLKFPLLLDKHLPTEYLYL